MSDIVNDDEILETENIDSIETDDNQGISNIYIEDEIKASYLDYSMSVIVSRALPDVRDGLKPVHRRILFAMNEMGMTYDKAYKKSARIVGEVLGKYHPHGDTAVYHAMVRMAQNFNYRYMLIQGHGNFGSVDGDSAAAMRYTEARMAKITTGLLDDIDKNTIDFAKNFDETLEEPKVLPAKLPNLLLNGAAGIAVGMATNIPPHNLCELVDAIQCLIENPEASIEDLYEHLKGPDFPTGGIINGMGGILEAYKTGRGKIRVRAKAEIIEKDQGSKQTIIVHELPYQVNKARLIENIAELAKDKKITGISDLRDESDRDGMRIVIEIKRGENAEVVLNTLFKFTDMEVTFGIILLALVKNIPRVLNLKEILHYYLEHRFEVITRRTQFELNKCEARAHILEGFRIALDHIEQVIKTIRASKDAQEAKERLIEQFKFSDIQAKAILEMRLQRLTNMERNKIDEEYAFLMTEIIRLKEILANPTMIYGIISKEIVEIKEQFGDNRRTEIQADIKEINLEDLIKDEPVIVTLTNGGYIKRMPIEQYRTQKRGGRGSNATSTLEDDFVENMYLASNHDTLLIFTNLGKVFNIKVYEIPTVGKNARGKLVQNLIQMGEDEKVRAIIQTREYSELEQLLFVTRKGIVKKTALNLYKNINRSGIRAITLKEDDDLVNVLKLEGDCEVVLGTKLGFAIRFNSSDVSHTGRTASGVIGIKLRNSDGVVGSIKVDEGTSILTIAEKGIGKRTKVDNYLLQKRSGKGVINLKITENSGTVVAIKSCMDDDEVMIITKSGTLIRTAVKNIRSIGRATQGVRIMNVTDDCVTSMVKVDEVKVDEIEENETI
ncbi:MAG: DNA gyrase subunit A [Fusobacteria bacterium]|nr:DNA gyrase subunit A [Fusobacteriota bacterium]